jgi:hypothetical protein
MTVTGGGQAPGLTRLIRPEGDDPLATLRFLRALRQAAADCADVGWQADVPVAENWLLHHLPPPESAVGGLSAGALADWRAAYRPGLCHYRRGPGFLVVSDGRGGAPVMTTLTGAAAEAFVRYLDVDQAPAADPVFGRLVRMGLILPLGDLALTLPYRIRRWPIPCTSV